MKASKAEVVIVGVGAPKQELWDHRFHDRIAAKEILCVGATIDFLAGDKSQAPVWLRLEWLHRCATETRRLVRRYAEDTYLVSLVCFRE